MERGGLDPELERARMCLGCSYGLGGLTHADRCPECGTPFDPGTIALPLASAEARWVAIVVAVVIASFAAIALVIVGQATRWGAAPVGVVVALGVGCASGCVMLTRRWWHRGVEGSMIAFTPVGVRERVMGVWTSEMPYAHLARAEVQPSQRAGRWTVRIDLTFAWFSLPFIRGTVELSEGQGRALRDELAHRMER